MMNSRLEQRPGQKSVLRVYYDPTRRDWDEQIRRALEQHGFKNRLNVLVVAVPTDQPMKERSNDTSG